MTSLLFLYLFFSAANRRSVPAQKISRLSATNSRLLTCAGLVPSTGSPRKWSQVSRSETKDWTSGGSATVPAKTGAASAEIKSAMDRRIYPS